MGFVSAWLTIAALAWSAVFLLVLAAIGIGAVLFGNERKAAEQPAEPDPASGSVPVDVDALRGQLDDLAQALAERNFPAVAAGGGAPD